MVDVERMRRSLERTPTLAERLFTEAERTYAESAADPSARYAARFAAKEATMKALGVGLGAFGWHDVEVVRADGGRPELALAGRAADLAVAAGIERWLVTLSHSKLVAQATVVAL